MNDDRRIKHAESLMRADKTEDAVPILEELAEEGNVTAAYTLAWIYSAGLRRSFLDKLLERTHSEPDKSRFYYFRAAKLGHQHAQTILARWYFEGDEEPQDFDEAFFWARHAVNNPNVTEHLSYALTLLAEMYVKGTGCKPDIPHGVLLRSIAEEFRVRAEREHPPFLPDLMALNFNVPEQLEKWAQEKACEYWDSPVPILVADPVAGWDYPSLTET